MPLTIGSIYLFGQILSFALPVSLLIAFATFFTRQARKLGPNPTPPRPSRTGGAGQQAPTPAAPAVSGAPAAAAGPTAPDGPAAGEPAAPGGPYTGV